MNTVPSSLPDTPNEDELLALCPQCAYQLHGLPVLHRCPECGLDVDRRWQVYGGRTIPRKSIQPGRVLKVFVLIWALIPISVLAVVMFLFAPRGEMFLAYFVCGGAFGVLIWTILRKPRAFIAVGPDGVFVQKRRGVQSLHPWGDVKSARHDLMRKSLVLELADDRDVRLPTFDFFGWYIAEADRCVGGIRRYPESAKRKVDSGPAE